MYAHRFARLFLAADLRTTILSPMLPGVEPGSIPFVNKNILKIEKEKITDASSTYLSRSLS